MKEQRQILKFIRIERFYLFFFWTYSNMLSKAAKIKERMFLYKRSVACLKRLRQFIYSLNYLVNNKPQRKQQMYQCYSNIRSFLLNTLSMMIDNLTHLQSVKSEKYPNMSDPKHLILLKTLYGMVDEMLSKNFLEDKRTNQKNLFEREMAENSKLNDG
jgi:hypothetical protein